MMTTTTQNATTEPTKASFQGGTLTYRAEPTTRNGFYRVETKNWVATFSRNSFKVTWGGNDERFCLVNPETVVDTLRQQMFAMEG